jgi:hypothetical protein
MEEEGAVAVWRWPATSAWGDVSAGAASGGAEDGPEVVIDARVGDVGVGEESAGAANGGAEGGPEVVIGARVVLGDGSGGGRWRRYGARSRSGGGVVRGANWLYSR